MPDDLQRAAQRGEPSYVWRAGQARRLDMIREAAEGRLMRVVLDNGCGVGQYLQHLEEDAQLAIGLEYDSEHVRSAYARGLKVVRGASEQLPYPDDSIDVVLSHEVLEHVESDRHALQEIVRVLRIPRPQQGIPAGRLMLFIPNRGYPFETHGIYWLNRYHFGNIPLVNYLPRRWRDHLAPHVRVYSKRDVVRLLEGLPLEVIHRTVIFGAYDNIIARWPRAGRILRRILQALEHTPFKNLGLSHFWVLQRRGGDT